MFVSTQNINLKLTHIQFFFPCINCLGKRLYPLAIFFPNSKSAFHLPQWFCPWWKFLAFFLLSILNRFFKTLSSSIHGRSRSNVGCLGTLWYFFDPFRCFGTKSFEWFDSCCFFEPSVWCVVVLTKPI